MQNNKLKFVFSVLLVFLLSTISFAQDNEKPKTGSGSGSGNGVGIGDSQTINKNTNPTVGIKVLSKVPAKYTDPARKNGTEGVVRLRVTFLASGEIGTVTPVTGLPYGLTEQAIAAARQIKFTPAMRNGVPMSVTKLVEYGFSIYYNENDEDLEKNAEILEMPDPKYPASENDKNLKGKIRLKVLLKSNGQVEVLKVIGDLSKEFQEEAVKAASKIKFNPAIHKNGNAVSQAKEIEYEFKPQKN